MRENTFGGMHCQDGAGKRHYTNLPRGWLPLNRRSCRFFAEFFNRFGRHGDVGDIGAEDGPARHGRSRAGPSSAPITSTSRLPRRPLVKLRQIQPAALLLFHHFQPHFQLFQPPS